MGGRDICKISMGTLYGNRSIGGMDRWRTSMGRICGNRVWVGGI